MESKTQRIRAQVPPENRDLLGRPVIAHLATHRPNGDLQSNPVWFEWDGEHVKLSQTKARQKMRNVDYDPHVALSLTDPLNPYRYLEIRGVVERIEDDPGNTFIDHLSDRYLQQTPYPLPSARRRASRRVHPPVRHHGGGRMNLMYASRLGHGHAATALAEVNATPDPDPPSQPEPVVPEPDPTHTPVIPEPDPTHGPILPGQPAPTSPPQPPPEPEPGGPVARLDAPGAGHSNDVENLVKGRLSWASEPSFAPAPRSHSASWRCTRSIPTAGARGVPG